MTNLDPVAEGSPLNGRVSRSIKGGTGLKNASEGSPPRRPSCLRPSEDP
jgi:hypothetical protein